jgi:Lar family restriction alleviation protein
MRQNQGGFTARFDVTRTDGHPIDPARRYIVLDYAGSDPHAIVALRTYADSIEADNPQMAADVRDAIEHPENWPTQHSALHLLRQARERAALPRQGPPMTEVGTKEDTDMETLLPCPFCGANAAVEVDADDFDVARALCCKCGATGPWISLSEHNNTAACRTAAATAWNTRLDAERLSSPTEMREALEPIKQGCDASIWHTVNGERMKRIYVAESALARINAALERSHTTKEG